MFIYLFIYLFNVASAKFSDSWDISPLESESGFQSAEKFC